MDVRGHGIIKHKRGAGRRRNESEEQGGRNVLAKLEGGKKTKLKMKGQKRNAPDDCSHYFIELLKSQPLSAIPLWGAIGEL